MSEIKYDIKSVLELLHLEALMQDALNDGINTDMVQAVGEEITHLQQQLDIANEALRLATKEAQRWFSDNPAYDCPDCADGSEDYTVEKFTQQAKAKLKESK